MAPTTFTDTDLDELERSEALWLTQLSTNDRAFGDVLKEVRSSVRNRKARMQDPRYLMRLAECAEFLVLLREGHVSDSQLRETLSTSDFPILFGDILDTRLLNNYEATPNVWSRYAQRGTVADFRRSRMVALDGLQQPLYPSNRKPELDGVDLDNDLDETAYYTQVQVYERGVSFNWRMLMNRRGEFLSRIPQFFARAASRTEEKLAVSLYMDVNGPLSSFFSNGNGNIINIANGASTDNPPLGINGLKDGVKVMRRQRDSGGDPIIITGMILLVPPELELDAIEIVKAQTLEIVPPTSATGTRIVTPPWVNRFQVVTNWYHPIVASSDANADTTWFLFADPNESRPALEVTFLQGYETPSMWQKAPNTQRLGGSVDPIMGDYDTGEIHQKVMHIIGGTPVDHKTVVVSNGSGT